MDVQTNTWTDRDIDAHLDLAWQQRDIDNADARRRLLAIYKELERTDQTTHIYRRQSAHAQVIDAFLLRRSCDFHQAFFISLDATATLAELGEDLWLARSYGNLGSLYLHFGLREDGIEYLLKQLQIGEAIQNDEMEAVAYHNLGMAASGIGDYKLAAEYFERSLLGIEAANNIVAYTYGTTNLVECWIELGRYNDASRALRECLDFARREGAQHAESVALRMTGTLDEALGNPEMALRRYKRAQEINEIHGNTYTGILLSMAIGRISIQNNELQQGRLTLNAALSASVEIGERTFQYQIHELLSDAYATNDEPEKALYHCRQHYQIKESVRNSQSEQRITNLKLVYENKRTGGSSGMKAAKGDTVNASAPQGIIHKNVSGTQYSELNRSYEKISALLDTRQGYVSEQGSSTFSRP